MVEIEFRVLGVGFYGSRSREKGVGSRGWGAGLRV